MKEEQEQKQEYYSTLFDEYLTKQVLPTHAQDDVLAKYMKEVLDDPGNKHLCATDVVWREILKSSLMEFFGQLLPHVKRLEEQAEAEKKHMMQFLQADIQKKRQMWPALEQYMAQHYSPAEVNLDGYVRLMRENRIEKDVIFEALIKDWKQACEQRTEIEMILLLESNKKRFEERVLQVGQMDYQTIKKTEKIVCKYPQLQEIIRCMGREKLVVSEEEDQTITRYIPVLLAHSKSKEEIEGVKVGNDLNALLPTEVVWLSDPQTEQLFYQKLATSQLQLFASKPPLIQEKKTDKDTQKKPRLQLGPMIICVDTSGSMRGAPENIAKALTMQILQAAKRKNRKCFLITYSVRTKILEISQPHHWPKVKDFLKNAFTGGTDGEEMFNAALHALSTKNYTMADVLIISDFEFYAPRESTRERVITEQQKGTRFYGLQIGEGQSKYKRILDRMWYI